MDNSLFEAVLRSDLNETIRLLEQGVEPNVRNSYTKNTLLHLAVSSRNYDIVRCLMEYGANPHRLNNYHQTPIDIARSRGCDKMVDLLNDYFVIQTKGIHEDYGHNSNPHRYANPYSYGSPYSGQNCGSSSHIKSLKEEKGECDSINGQKHEPVSKPLPNSKEEEEQECPVCFDSLNQDNSKILICGHGFCVDCISKWDNMNGTCPLCRGRIQMAVPVAPVNNLCPVH
jgi:ankyrin repeat protein